MAGMLDEDGRTLEAAVRPDSLSGLRRRALSCRRCDLWVDATQTVFGEGSAKARLMLVGEQPGDQEDLRGHPFVGPAGRLLDGALTAAGVDRTQTYVTNAVKHFKWIPRGKRHIHQKPNTGEMTACRPWLEAEIEVVSPEVVVLMGATAAQAVMGPDFRVTRERGRLLPSPMGIPVVATVHPAAILRAPDEESRKLEMARFIEDLKVAGAHVARH